ncbi:MAG: hypothetical protein IPK73_06380 [Candidatus Obscuribacter sp.]|nr:hypothetical protein [Candidatus Obscuribacter sp.]MBK9279218.1 hypothetical protein [Candidatus Obscuribacter sp.]
MSKDMARDNTPAKPELLSATEDDTRHQPTDTLRGEFLSVKGKERSEKPQPEKPADTAKERDGSLSINGVPRNLDLSEEESGAMEAGFKGTRKGKNGSGHKPEKLPEPVLTEEEKQLQAASKLITAYENRLDKEVLNPAAKTLFDSLDQIERNMPKDDLAKLELARLRFQENKSLEEEMQAQVEEKGLLLYIEPTQRPKEMKDFDAQARQLFKDVMAGAAPKVEQLQKDFPGLSEAYQLLRKLEQEEEGEKEPTWQA